MSVWAAIVLLAGTALFSYAVVQQSSQRMFTSFVYELSQKPIIFVGLRAHLMSWGAILKLPANTRTQLVQLVLLSACISVHSLRLSH